MSALARNSLRYSNSLKNAVSGRPSASKCIHSSVMNCNEKFPDIPTHTGQVWDTNDFRMARFEVAPKQVNSQWAVDLIKEVPPIAVKGRIAVCEGGPSEALGHPKIYINLDEPGPKSCIYCGLRYFKEDSHH